MCLLLWAVQSLRPGHLLINISSHVVSLPPCFPAPRPPGIVPSLTCTPQSWKNLVSRQNLPMFVMSSSLAAFQQLTGINASEWAAAGA